MTKDMLGKRSIWVLLGFAWMGQAAAQSTQDLATYRAFATPTELRFFDPASPDAAPLTVDTVRLRDTFSSFGISAGTWGAGGEVTDLHQAVLPYVKNGRLRRVSLLKSETPSPRQFSSETQACGVVLTFADFRNTANSGVFYSAAGADGNCGTNDDVERFTRLGAGRSAAPISLAANQRVLAPLYNRRTGAISGYVLKTGARIDRTDPLLAVVEPIMTLAAASEPVDTVQEPSLRSLYLITRKSGDAGNARIYRYSGSTLSAPLYSFGNAYADQSDVNGRSLFVIDGNQIIALDHRATAARTLATNPLILGGTLAAVSRNAVLVNRTDFTTFSSHLTAFSLADGSALPLLPETQGVFLSGVFALGDRIHYSVSAGRGFDARLVRDNGSNPRVFRGGFWQFGQLGTDNTAIEGGFESLVLARPQTTTPPSVEVSLSSASGTYGPVPMGVVSGVSSNNATVFLFGLGRYLVGAAELRRPDNSVDEELLLLDSATPGSLRTVQEGIGTDERPLSF